MDDEKEKDGHTAPQDDRPEEKTEPASSPPPDLDIVREERRRLGDKGWGDDE